MRFGLLFCAMMLLPATGAAAPQLPPEPATPSMVTYPSDLPPPEWLRPYLVNGMPDPNNIGWMRGLFDDASPADKANWKALEAWGDRCWAAGHAAALAELKAMGEAAPELEKQKLTSAAALCKAIDVAKPQPSMRKDWNAYRVANDEAGRFFSTFMAGAEAGQGSFMIDPKRATEDGFDLLTAPRREQVLRKAFSFEHKSKVTLDPIVSHALNRRLSLALVEEDHKNTAMLKRWVAEKGWPTITAVGEMPSNAAWLMVQHADNDPAFQLQALRLMEPLVAKGEVDKKNFAYLYDRVKLKTNGKQRYGTQMMCEAGKRVPQPLEDPQKLASLRQEVGLNPMKDYIAIMDEHFPPCPAK